MSPMMEAVAYGFGYYFALVFTVLVALALLGGALWGGLWIVGKLAEAIRALRSRRTRLTIVEAAQRAHDHNRERSA